ncbi:MAG: T9SS type A sorting domain-containing protein, partial [Bacteroidia bacterium]
VNSAVVSQSVSACTSINSVNGNNNQALKVFPNPSNGVFNIEADSSVEIELFDAQGKSVLKTKVEAGTFSLNINEKASGLYFLKATSNGQTSTIRLIKE